MTQISDIKYNIADLAEKDVTVLADRPDLSATDLKFRLDSNDIRRRINVLADAVELLLSSAPEERAARILTFDTANESAADQAQIACPHGERFFALFRDTGIIFCGTAGSLRDQILHNRVVPVWGGDQA